MIQNSFASIPQELWEAAAVDGAGVWRSLRLSLPLVRAGLITGTLGSIHWGILDASVVITAVPCLIVYIALQRHFVRGVMAGMGR